MGELSLKLQHLKRMMLNDIIRTKWGINFKNIFINIKVVNILLLLALITMSNTLNAQKRYVMLKNGIGAGGGFTNYWGSLNTDASLKSHTSLYASAFYRRRLAHQFYARVEGLIGMLRADNRSPDAQEGEITGAFLTQILEASLKGEYEFIDLSNNTITPYITGGVGGYVLYNYRSTMGAIKKEDKIGVVLPVGGGIKYKLNSRFKIFAEGNFRFFAKNLDNLKGKIFVNKSNYYFTIGAGLIYEMRSVNEFW